MIDGLVRIVLAGAVVLLVVVLVVAVVGVVAPGVWESAPFQHTTSCPVHVPGQTPWPGVPRQCLAGW